MKILLLGCNGQVGWELQRSLAPLGEVIALGRQSALNPQGLCGDLADLDALVHTVRAVRPQLIVNAAAYTAVDKAEADSGMARTVNAIAPGILADEAQRLGAWLLHYSTDYVFDGSGDQPWTEDHATGPLSVYGQTKLEGEWGVARCERHLIFRTSWVYAARGGNFAKTMIRLAQTREKLQVIHDQFGAPTGAELLADVTAHAVSRVVIHMAGGENTLAGIYHVAATGCTTWFDYANYVLAQVRIAQPAIKFIANEMIAVPTAAFPTAAKRPHNSRLDTSKFRSTFGLNLPVWEDGVARMIRESNHDITT